MTQKNKYCPHCGFPYVTNDHSGSYYLGSPIRVCSRCGKQFADKEFKELAFFELKPWDTWYVTLNTIIAVLGVSIISFASFKTGWIWFGIILIVIGLWLLFSDILGYNNRIAYIEKERKESIARMSDPNYANLLKKLDIEVPEKFLKDEEKTNL